MEAAHTTRPQSTPFIEEMKDLQTEHQRRKSNKHPAAVWPVIVLKH
jgi:hypothetical protein